MDMKIFMNYPYELNMEILNKEFNLNNKESMLDIGKIFVFKEVMKETEWEALMLTSRLSLLLKSSISSVRQNENTNLTANSPGNVWAVK